MNSDEECYVDLLVERDILKDENRVLKKAIRRAINIIKNDCKYDDQDFESRRFQEDILKELEVIYNGRKNKI